MGEYKINYSEYADKKMLRNYFESACFSDIFDRGTLRETTQIILYIPKIHLNISFEEFLLWVKGVNNAGFPCQYLGISTVDKELDWLGFVKEYYIVTVPVNEYKNITHLTAGLTYIRYAYDWADGHSGKSPYKMCLDYIKIKEKYNVDDFSAIIGASILYGHGGNHQVHNTKTLKLFTLEEFIDKSPKTGINSGGRNLHTTSNKFASGKSYASVEELKNFYSAGANVQPKLKVYVVGGDNNYANWLPNIKIVKKLKDADLALFTGGEDVSPKYYGEEKHIATYTSPQRDTYEKRIFNLARKQGKKILGICRGSQFVCVMSGGKLVQHQQNKYPVHAIHTEKYGGISISSTHHQAQYPFNLPKWDYKIIGWTNNISEFHQNGKQEELNPEFECEIVHYPKTQCLGIQGHPEFADYQNRYPDDLTKIKEIFTDFVTNNL